MKFIQYLSGTLFFLSLVFCHVEGQNPKKAEELYQDFGYKTSIPIFESLVQKEGADQQKAHFIKIANSYRLVHDTRNAEKWYAEVVKLSDEPIHKLHYAQALQSNGKNDQAKNYFLQYHKVAGDADRRGELLAAAIDRMNEIRSTDIKVLNEQIINSGSLEFSPAYYQDYLVFVSSRSPEGGKPAELDIWTDDHFMTLFQAKRKVDGGLEAPAVFSDKITTKYHEGPVSFSRNGDQIFFTRNNFNNGKLKKSKDQVVRLKIYTARKTQGEWGDVEELSFSTDEYDESHPALSADGTHLFFSSNREGGYGGMDLYLALLVNGTWAVPVNLGPNINTAGNEVFPFIHDDGTLYYSSDGWGGLGGLDIFSATLVDSADWTRPVNIGTPFNSQKDDIGFILNVLGTEGYLSSAREGGVGGDDIYSFTLPADSIKKPVPAVRCMTLKGVVTNINGGNRIPGATVTLAAQYSNIVYSLESDLLGEFKFPCLDCQYNYTLTAEKQNFHSATEIVDLSHIDCSEGGALFYELKLSSVYDDAGPSVIAPSEPREIEVGTVVEIEDIYYDFDKYNIRPGAAKTLDRIFSLMEQYPSMELELSAHTDSRGHWKYNSGLSKRRAASAVSYLVSKGVVPNRLKARGWGESQLRNHCDEGVDCTEAEHQYNRRTEMKITRLDRGDIKVEYLDNLPETVDPYIPVRRKSGR